MTTYKEAGVDIEAGEEAVDRIKPLAKDTFTPGVLTDIGAFGAFFEPDFSRFEKPVLVSSIDGVGTKLKVAVRANRYDTIGQDLVNHCVNDIAVGGATPLFFLDYIGTADLEPDTTEALAKGFSSACKENGCALIGGEIAEMPDVYGDEDIDLVGAIVGVADKERILDGRRVKQGDAIIGLPSTGLHTNGYTLARTVLYQHYRGSDQPPELDGETVNEALLRVHRSYLEPIQTLMEHDLAQAFSHITGGGLPGNVRRVVSGSFQIEYESWDRPPLFKLIQQLGDVPEEDMRRTFNLGIGLVAIVREEDLTAAMDLLRESGESPQRIGRVTST